MRDYPRIKGPLSEGLPSNQRAVEVGIAFISERC